ncbi:MAG TPA: PEP-CTERM sorting domain-containing protein [Bryobacteraceae bacterium]
MKRFFIFLAVVVLCLVPASMQGATVLLSENFDELTAMLSVTSVGAFSAIDGTNVDIVGPGDGFPICVAPASGNCVDMDGTGGNPQGVLQSNSSFTLVPGTDYFLSYDLIGSQRGVTASTTVTFGPYTQTFNLTSGDVTSGIVSNALITVSSPTTVFLTFTSNTPGEVGDLLDNVLLTSTPASAVPEPSTLMLVSPGLLLGFAGMVRRRFRARSRRTAVACRQR